MRAIYLKEIRAFFSSLSGYLVLCLFLLVCGLFVFVLNNPYNVLDFGFADLTPFFMLVPWLFIFMIPAICMRSFTMERDLGTLEILLTRPLSIYELIVGKYMAALSITILALIPTLLYVWTIGLLGTTYFNIDLGATMGGYLGALMVGMCFVAISIFCSTLHKNQIISFLIAAFLCFVMYFGFEGLSSYLSKDSFIESLGMKYHYQSMARGVLDTRDIIYFVSVTLLFIILSKVSLQIALKKK